MWAVVFLACLVSAKAQVWDLSITSTPALVTTNDVITFEMAFANNTGGTVEGFQLNVGFSEAVEFRSATNFYANGTATVDGSDIVYSTPFINPFTTNFMSLRISATRPGVLTNFYNYFANNEFDETKETRKVIFSAEADLGVSILSPTNTLVARDWIKYRLMITNAGPGTVNGIVVTTTWPTDTDLISSNPLITSAPGDNELIFTTPGLVPGTNLFYDIVIQPNTIGAGKLFASLYVDGLLDPTPGNNKATNTVTLGAAHTANLEISQPSGQTLNPQTGFMEQTFRLTNNGPTNIPTARVMIGGFPYQVMSAAGTNASVSTNGIPFVTLTRPLAPSERAEFLLEYFIPSRVEKASPILSALSVPQFILGAPTGNSMKIYSIHKLDSGNVLIDFAAVSGKSYSVIYSNEATLTNAVRALPPVSAPANGVQWIDAGPPKTSRRPGDTDHRFYRVIELTE